MNRFKNGWFTLFKFTENVAENSKYHQELVEFTASNKIDQPKYEDPVIIFTARKPDSEITQRSERKQAPARKVNLTIGIDDNDAEGGPSKQKDPLDEILAPVLELNSPKKQEPPKEMAKPGLIGKSDA